MKEMLDPPAKLLQIFEYMRDTESEAIEEVMDAVKLVKEVYPRETKQ